MQKRLYSDEKNIVELVIKKLNSYGHSNKELIKKQNELFHLLCYFSLDKKYDLYDYIKPNEPGDFIIEKDHKKYLFEVAECFGNKDSYIYINNCLNILFNREKRVVGNYDFSIVEAKDILKRIIDDKNHKIYNRKKEYDSVYLLIVTGEYSGCSSTGNWIIKYLNSCDISDCIYKICFLDYYASGKDGNPIIIKDVIKEIDRFKDYFKDYNNSK